jgi:hypothetical protein
MVPYWFDSSFANLWQWLPAVLSGLAVFASQLFARTS